MADSQNYGDDVAAKDLVNPRPFADLAVAPDAMDEMRPKQKILELFARIGYNLDHNLADKLFYQASRGEEYTSINSFQNVLNQYLISQG